MNRPQRSIRALSLLLLAVCGVAPAQPQTAPRADVEGPVPPRETAPAGSRPALLIDASLAPRAVELVSLDARTLTVIDEQGRKRLVPRTETIALLPVPAAPAAARRPAPLRIAPGMLELADGQRFPGDLLATGDPTETLSWNHITLGKLTVDLEDVSSFWRPGLDVALRRGAREQPPANDALLLTNGDWTTGYLAAAGEVFRFEADGAELQLPQDRVAGGRLSNAPTQPPRGETWVWLEGGTTAKVSRLGVEPDGRVSLALDAGPSGSVEWGQLRAVAFDVARFRPLSALTIVEQAPGDDRRYAPPMVQVGAPLHDVHGVIGPALGAWDLLLPGPMSVTWQLPKGASRVAFTAALEDGAQPWGDCDLVVLQGDAEAVRRRLIAGAEPVPVALTVRGERLTIRVEAGKHGPIKDRVVLSRPIVLLD